MIVKTNKTTFSEMSYGFSLFLDAFNEDKNVNILLLVN